MANYKRHKPRLHWVIDCCPHDGCKTTGNHRGRMNEHELRKPQFYHEDTHKNMRPWRYKNVFDES